MKYHVKYLNPYTTTERLICVTVPPFKCSKQTPDDTAAKSEYSLTFLIVKTPLFKNLSSSLFTMSVKKLFYTKMGPEGFRWLIFLVIKHHQKSLFTIGLQNFFVVVGPLV